MKRYGTILLILALSLCLCGCMNVPEVEYQAVLAERDAYKVKYETALKKLKDSGFTGFSGIQESISPETTETAPAAPVTEAAPAAPAQELTDTAEYEDSSVSSDPLASGEGEGESGDSSSTLSGPNLSLAQNADSGAGTGAAASASSDNSGQNGEPQKSGADQAELDGTEETEESSERDKALSTAVVYLSHSTFSRKALIQILELDGFSKKASVYAADHCKADWMEQALNTAKGFLNYTSFTYEGMVEHLKSEGFTDEEADYAASALTLPSEETSITIQ